MARVDTDEVTVLTAFVNLLLAAFTQLNASTCYMTLQPEAAPAPPGGDFWLTVSGGPGAADEEMQDDAGESQVMENQIIRVGIFTRIRLDKVGYDASLLANATRGLKVLKQQVIKALVNKDPVDGNDDTFLRETIKYAGGEGSNHDKGKAIGWEVLNFRAMWDWNLA